MMEKKASSKQVFLFAAINYMGTAIGILSSILIYPQNKELYGYIGYIDGLAQLLFPVMVLGASHALIKFYPALDDDRKKELFNYSIISVSVISLIVFTGITIYVNAGFDKNSELLYYAFPIAVALAFVELFRKQAQDLQKLAVPTFYEKILPKIALAALFLLFLGNYIGMFQSMVFYALCYILIFLLTGFYIYKHYKPGFNYKFKTLFGQISRKDYFRYSLYAFAGSLGSLLAFRIDSILIFNLLSESENGTFKIGSNLASALQIPAIGMFALYAPIISGYLKSGNFKELQMKYREVAKLLFFIGAILFSCIFLGIEDLFRLLPTYENLKGTIPIILILGFSVLINMATGFNGEIITYSKYYRFNLIAIVFLIVLNVGLNLYFIYYTSLGIIGVAYASLIAMTMFNISKLVFIYKKFRLLPFDSSFVKLAVVFAISGLGIYLLPDTGSHIVNLIYKTGLSLFLNVMVVSRLKLVYQVNEWIDKAFSYIR